MEDYELDKYTLGEGIAQLNVMDDFYRPLSELVLQRKITEKDDAHDVAVEVEQILWKHGRDLLKKRETESRNSG